MSKKIPEYYHAHGLCIKSFIHIPGLLSERSKPDVLIHFNNFNLLSDSFLDYSLGDSTLARVASARTDLYWQDICVCSISEGREIVVNPSTGLEESFIRTLIFGIALAILLHQRGMLVLHANGVDINGNAVAFIGPPGRGKSTTSIFLHKKGYNLLSDDILCVKNENDHPLIFSGFNTLKLRPEVIEILGENPESMPKVNSYYHKHFYNLINNSNPELIPLKAIYLIEEGEKTIIKDMSIQDSLVELVKSSYCAKLFNNEEMFLNLKQSAQIVEKVPIKILKVKRSFNDLQNLMKTIEDDFFRR